MIAMTVMTVNIKNAVPVKKTPQTRRGKPLQFYASDDFIASLDRWRAQQQDVPGRSEAIRRIVERFISIDRAVTVEKKKR